MSKRNKIKAGLTASLNKLKFIVPKVITDGVNVGTVNVIVKKHSNRHIYIIIRILHKVKLIYY